MKTESGKEVNISDKKIIVFDLDGTLTVSKSVVDDEMAQLIVKLLEKYKVAIISGGLFSQFEKQFTSHLPIESSNLENLFLLPTSGTRMYVWKDTWIKKYSEDISEEDRKKIIKNIGVAIALSGVEIPRESYGEKIEDRESQVTFSALGQEAPFEIKSKWDPDMSKRQKIAEILREKIPNFDVLIGGSSSLDVTMKGVDKAYGIHKLIEYLKIDINQVMFIGDTIFPGGNDYSAKSTRADCVQVNGPDETKMIIKELLP